ncbi:hypothetical protein [Streptomyces sp. NRRL B-24572]|uniref:hypothetical protein n=1 Tax=Streptomyces sp. NRRL B-24572 TaxID=1962156 RepID=UPI0015C4FEDD|nr:hypothetical protein [Streptomyces sp. NRRL B-24572]
MTTTRTGDPKTTDRPAFELRAGGMHVIIQRVPGWLVALVTTVGGAAGTWWAQR